MQVEFGFLPGEAQLMPANLQQLAAGAQAGQGKGGIDACSQHQAHGLRRMAQNLDQQLVDGLARDQVEVIQNQDEALLAPQRRMAMQTLKLVDQPAGQYMHRRQLAGLQQAQGLRTGVGNNSCGQRRPGSLERRRDGCLPRPAIARRWGRGRWRASR